MRGNVRKRFISFQGAHEAVVEYMYLDSKSVVTVGIGFLIDSQGSAIPLGGWTRKTDGTPATEQEIATNGTWRKTQELPESESP